MMESSQSVIRIALLTAFTALFAGVWANDRPIGSLAQLEPRKSHPVADLGRYAASEVCHADLRLAGAFETGAAEACAGRPAFAVDRQGLLISAEALDAHLARLPELAAGEYRIVDSLGGVGWLSVRGDLTGTAGSPELVTTSIERQPVRFIRVAVRPRGFEGS